jgi:hypothetical protein
VYDERLTPDRLSDEQKQKIFAYARSMSPAGQRPWYVKVRYNDQRQGEPSWAVSIFYSPYSTSSRLRKGKAIGMVDFQGRWTKLLRRTVPNWDEQQLYWDYWQVSPSQEPFGKDLVVPDQPFWPFKAPEGLTDQEVVEIVDFVRTYSVRPYAETAKTMSLWSTESIDKTLPIFSISKGPDGKFEVWTGTLQGGLSGIGQTLTITKENGKFVLLALGMWLS